MRPERLKEARAEREKGAITPDELRNIEDEEIVKIIRQQEEVRPEARDRRRVPPLVVAFRLLRSI